MCLPPARHTLQGGTNPPEGAQQRSWLTAALMSRVYALQDRVMDFVLKRCIICAHNARLPWPAGSRSFHR